MAEAEVSNLNRQIAEARADRAEKDARVAEAQAQVRRGGGGADTNAALTSDTIRELRTREAETSVQLAQLTVRFKDDYPEVKRTQAAAQRHPRADPERDQPHHFQSPSEARPRAARSIARREPHPAQTDCRPTTARVWARRASAARGCGEEDLRGLSNARERGRRRTDPPASPTRP